MTRGRLPVVDGRPSTTVPRPSRIGARLASATSIVESFLSRSTVEGEKTVARVRLAACALVLTQRVVMLGAIPSLWAGDPFEWMSTLGLLSGMAFSLSALSALRRKAPAWLPLASVVMDAVIVTTIMVPQVLWPTPGWTGVLARPAWGFLMLAAIASGFRLTLPAVALGVGAAGASLVGQVLLDGALNGPAVAPRLDTVILAGIVWVGATGLAYGVTTRTRALVEDGALEALKAERARQRLVVYISQEIADAALETDLLRPGGERREVAVLFSDLRGFTTYGERLEPERLIDELNAYLDAMVEVIRDEGGVVDKYIGDAIMVVFGIPKSRADDATRAVRCARRMQESLAAHNLDRQRRGLIALRHGIGVHYGAVVAGNVGTDDRLQYTVVGDVVNTASRLEGTTKDLRETVLISLDTIQATGLSAEALGLKPAGEVPLRGRDATLNIFSLLDDPEPWRDPPPR